MPSTSSPVFSDEDKSGRSDGSLNSQSPLETQPSPVASSASVTHNHNSNSQPPLAAAVQRPSETQPPSTKADTMPKDMHMRGINKTTAIDGCNLWSSWTRNYSTPLLAFWDLADNVLDAACPETGRVVIDADYSYTTTGSGARNNNPKNATVRGMTVTNSCRHPIPDLRHILKAYNSDKGRRHDDNNNSLSIGENGVGLKQGCATLSDLSFVLTKRYSKELSIGMIAKDLQKTTGVYLPSFNLAVDVTALEDEDEDDDDGDRSKVETAIAAELLRLAESDTDIRHVFAQYGNGSLQDGADGLAHHFGHLLHDWHDDEHVFMLVLYNLKHSSRINDALTNGNGTAPDDSPSAEQLKRIAVGLREKPDRHGQAKTVGEFLGMIQDDLPKRYLHVDNSFTVLMGHVHGNSGSSDTKTQVEFNYWQRRLVEMTHFAVIVNTQQPISAATLLAHDNNGIISAGDNDGEYKLGDNEYVLNVYCGFDAERCASETAQKTAMLLCHSRRAGRLIKSFTDARNELFLTSGGTQYCQGLTVIIDDVNGMLPLNPTKQDFAFGERVHGEVHRSNMVAWVGAVTKVYWSYHFEVTHGYKKELLSKQIKALVKEVKKWKKNDSFMPSISDCTFSTIEGMVWKLYKKKEGPTALQVKNKQLLKLVPADDTLIKFSKVKIEATKGPGRPKSSASQSNESLLPAPVRLDGPASARKRKHHDMVPSPPTSIQPHTSDAACNEDVAVADDVNQDFVPRQQVLDERVRGDRYKEKARVYRDQRDENGRRIAELSVQVSKLQKELQALRGAAGGPNVERNVMREYSI